MRVRSRSIAIIAAPLAAWALFSCLSLVGVDADVAIAAALAWATFWVVVAWIGVRRGGMSASMRDGAIVTSLMLPFPVYVLTLLVDWLAFIPASVGVPMFSMLCSAAPLVLWVLALRPTKSRRASAPILVIPWHHYTPSVPAAVIPPRRTQ